MEFLLDGNSPREWKVARVPAIERTFTRGPQGILAGSATVHHADGQAMVRLPVEPRRAGSARRAELVLAEVHGCISWPKSVLLRNGSNPSIVRRLPKSS